MGFRRWWQAYHLSVCGGPRDDTACPQGQGPQAYDAGGGDAAGSAADFGFLKRKPWFASGTLALDLRLPPENAGQARGYVNQSPTGHRRRAKGRFALPTHNPSNCREA